jgi:hypothetical protein
MTATLVDQAHRLSVLVPLDQAVRELQEMLTRRMVAYVAGVKDAKTVTRWATGEVTDMRSDSEQRVRTAYEIAQLLSQYESAAVVRAWFIGLNPHLDDASPAEAIHEGRLKEALGAARAFVAAG